MNVTITLLIYWSIAAGLIGGGIFALAKGFKLVMEGRGKTKEESTVEFMGLKASVGSIGSLVMVTAFMWGWAAKLALPSYKDPDVEIHALRQEFEQIETALASLREEHSAKIAQMANLEARLAGASSELEQSRAVVAAAEYETEVKQTELQTRLDEQQSRIAELQAAIKKNDPAKIEQKATEIEEASEAINKTIKSIF